MKIKKGVIALWARTLVLSACCVATSACERGVPSERHRPENAPERRIHATQWDKILEIGTSEEDTTLISPHRLVASTRGVYVIDYIPKRVLHFSHGGVHLWSYGRAGAGPDEFQHPLDLKIDPEANAWIFDQQNVRLSVLDSDGNPVHVISLASLPMTVHEIIPLSNKEALLVVDRPKAPFVHIGTNGDVRDQFPFPWAGYATMDYLATQLITASSATSNVWVAGFRMGDGFFVFDAERWSGVEGWYSEPIPFPEVITTQSGNSRTRRHAGRPVGAARAITLSPQRLYVLFGGESEYGNRVVDSFSLSDGKYQASYLLPEKVRGIAWHDGGLYTVRHDPFPQIAFWRSQEVQLP